MLHREILKLRSSEIAGNVYFSIHLAFSRFLRRQPICMERATLPESLKSKGACVP